MFNAKFLGGVLLIVGTSIGAGMLALPVANASAGFWTSSIFLFLCWAVMTAGAFLILEANLYLPPGTHMVSMAEATLGKPGLLAAWLSYLFLLYTLLSAYISGGADVFGSLINAINIPQPAWLTSLLFTLIFGLIVYGGIRQVDLLNRGLMFGKLAIYVLLTVVIAPHVHSNYLIAGDVSHISPSIMILITSFGFAIIVPNLRDYFNNDVKTLRYVILIGSLIPLFCYLAWDAIIMGSIPSQGSDGLIALMNSEHTTSTLSIILAANVQNPWITACFTLFTSICMLTAFLGVSLCLISFLADGLRTTQQGWDGLGLFLLTFAPPLLIVIFYPGIYIHALAYAGIFCVILLLLLPALMVLSGRKKFTLQYQVKGGSLLVWLVIVVSVGLLIHEVWRL